MRIRDCASVVVELCNEILIKGSAVALPKLNTRDWKEVFQFASSQGVLPIVMQALERLKATGGPKLNLLKVKWCGVSLQNQQGYYLRVEVMKSLAKLFEREGIDIMFMKGASLAQLYPKPEWRVFSDIDFYLFGESDRGIALMNRNGIENKDFFHHHTQASVNGVLLENHYDFVERKHYKCDIILDNALKALSVNEGHSYRAFFLGESVKNAYVMSPTMNAIFLMRHMSAHFASETITLRMLYDWALFLKKLGSKVDWEYVCKMYEESGMIRFAQVLQGILSSRLGFEIGSCSVPKGKQKDEEMVWKSVLYPPKRNPFEKNTLRYYLFEARTFLVNIWKYKMVYPGESILLLYVSIAWHDVKRLIQRRKGC